MKIPKKITPVPIISAVLEIRFEANIKDEDVLGVFYPLFSNEYPKLNNNNRQHNIPKELKHLPEFKYLSDYVIYNDNFILSFGRNVFVIEVNGNYCGWHLFFNQIKKELDKLSKKLKFQSIERLALRYQNIFNKDFDIDKIVNLGFRLENQSIFSKQKVNNFISDFEVDNINLLLQVSSDARSQNIYYPERKYRGVWIDIDSSYSKNASLIDDKLFKTIEELHEKEKMLFFNLLKSDFLKTLNPEY